MNNDPSRQPNVTRPPASAVPPRPSFAVPQRGEVSATPVLGGAPATAPIPTPAAPVPLPPAAPPVPVATPPAPITPPHDAASMIPSKPQPLPDWPRERTLHPINEAAILLEKAAAEESVAHPTKVASADEERLPQQNLEVPSALTPTPDDIERAPDNAPVSAQATTIEDFLPPVRDKNGKVDNKVEDEEVISWPKRIAAGIFVPIAWVLSTHGLSQLVSWFLREHVINTVSNNPQAIGNSFTLLLQTMNEWSWLVQSVPYIAIIPAALIAFFFLKYPHGGYRLLLALSVAAAMVGIVQLLPHIPALKEHIVAPSLVGAAIVQLFDAIKNFVSLQTIWVTIGLIVGIGLFVVLILYGAIRLVRFRVPSIVTVLILVVLAVTPIAVAVPLDIQARQEMIEQTNALIDRVSQ